MRIAKLAELTGTTVRTIRWYHEVGLLPVPETRYGYRDYGMVHVARLGRIRWLVDSGLSLDQVTQVVDADAGDGQVLADLRAAVAVAEERREQLDRQLDRLRYLARRAESESPLTPMPPGVAGFYDRIEARCTDERAARRVREERDFVELAYFRGEMPRIAELLYEGLDDAAADEAVAGFTRQALRRESGRQPTPDEADHIAEEVVARMKRRLGDRLPELVHEVSRNEIVRVYDLFEQTAGEAEPGVARRVMGRLLDELTRFQEGHDD